MDSDLLNAFIHVIDCGSLSKAAEQLFISATALMKQMNALEAQVGVQLLIRTNHGIRPTNAGNSFYQDAKFMMQYSEKAIVRARQAANKNPHVIRIGNSTLYPCKPLLDLWNSVGSSYPQFKMKIVPVDADSERWPGDYQNLGKDVDVMVGAYERATGFSSFCDQQLGEYRFCIAVSREHRLANRERLSVSDLYGQRIAMTTPGVSPIMDEIRGYLLTEHPEIQIKSVIQHYTLEVFNHCEEHGFILLTLEGWKDVHPSLITIPIDWGYAIPYGVIYPLKPSDNVQLFLSAIQETASPIYSVREGAAD